MSDELLLDMYKTLRELQYPGLTKANPSNFAGTILSAENRVDWLSWMLSQSSVKENFESLTGSALEEKLVKCYTELGICLRKEALLGTCDIKEQIPTLKFLLGFMKYVLAESPPSEPAPKVSIDAILKEYFSEDGISVSHSKLTYEEAVDYFVRVKEESKSNSDFIQEESKETEPSETTSSTQAEKSCTNELLLAEMENFEKLFTIPKEISKATNWNSWDESINGIHEKFSTLQQLLKINDELAEINIAAPILKAPTQLDQIIENIVISCEKARNI